MLDLSPTKFSHKKKTKTHIHKKTFKKIIKEKKLILFIQKRDKKTERFFIKNIRAFKKNRNKNEKETKTPLL